VCDDPATLTRYGRANFAVDEKPSPVFQRSGGRALAK